ncbi:hypothetical protein LEP1GSC151_2793 [Leptospira interrogans serovar Grippotyphosa str. LT2186]|uniref:Uncharacterized protein n=1 Tax=Leptospira interrogans serovar Grippotyphosa str. LT2186 TaxID=1001599 RepID=M3FXA6_LEPIR|nr:hypothetical protein LEP1GSC151_2793 [Leptospira interrogans serovar Grippotyphosa str. LT2186]
MELLTQAIFGLFIPLYVALVLFLSQWAFRFSKTNLSIVIKLSLFWLSLLG